MMKKYKIILLTFLLIFSLIGNCFAAVELDYMEYANDAAAQSAYVSSDTGADPNTVLLANLDGADGATAFTAETGQVATFVGTAQLDTAQKKFGTASLLCDGNSDFITFPDNATWDLGTGNFTVDAWIRPAAIEANAMSVVTHSTTTVTSTNLWTLYVNGAGKLVWLGNGANRATSTGVLEINTWYHVAAVRSGTSLKLYIDGVNDGSGTDASDYSTYDGPLQVGADNEVSGGWQFFNGWIDEPRVSKGIARWIANFTSPIRAYDLDKLICYSEPTIKQQGSYSLNGFAAQTGSLNDTLTRTVDPVIDLTGQTSWKLYIYSASRTGSNIKVGIHDSGGTTTEVTPNITSTGAWQLVDTDISAVSNANKDAIDSIIATAVNADADNTLYLDNMFGEIIAVAPSGWIWIE